MSVESVPTAHEIAKCLKVEGMWCNCDLDNWEPTQETGHSWVCRIHKAAVSQSNQRKEI